MLNYLHRKLLRKNYFYAQWHKNRFSSIVHFLILFLVAGIFAAYIQVSLEQGFYYHLASQQSAYSTVVLGKLAPPSPLEGSLLSAGYGIFFSIALVLVLFSTIVFLIFR